MNLKCNQLSRDKERLWVVMRESCTRTQQVTSPSFYICESEANNFSTNLRTGWRKVKAGVLLGLKKIVETIINGDTLRSVPSSATSAALKEKENNKASEIKFVAGQNCN